MITEGAGVLIEEHLHLPRVYALRAARRTGHWSDVDDLIAVGNEALIEAATGYLPDKGATFHTWASRIIQHRFNDYLRKEMLDAGGRGAPNRGEWQAQRVDDSSFIYMDMKDADAWVYTILGVDEPGYGDLEDSLTDLITLQRFDEWVKDRLSERDFKVYRAWLIAPKARDVAAQFGLHEARISQIVKELLRLAREYGRDQLILGP